jgi:hypothetical protein
VAPIAVEVPSPDGAASTAPQNATEETPPEPARVKHAESVEKPTALSATPPTGSRVGAKPLPSAQGDAQALGLAPAVTDTSAETAVLSPNTGWHFGGYSELLLATSFYHPDVTNTDPKYRDTHLDLARFSLFIGTDITKRISFSSEIEFEHGGTGVAREVEWEEFGEYETEVEKGGEIILEQAFLEGRPTDYLTLRAGHLLVPVGMTTLYHTPNLFSSARRPESESALIPSIWHENGIEIGLRAYDFAARLQVVTGLDSTGFSSSRWIAGGTQRSFEKPLANDLATVLAVDYLGLRSTVIGVSVYTSGSNKNRPKRDLYELGGRVTLGDIHARYQNGPFKLRGLVLVGHVENADEITRANASLSSNLGASRTAIGRAAYAAWLEGAYDLLPLFVREPAHRLDAFARVDAYDTMWRAGAKFDNPLLQRRAMTVGLNYFPHPRVVLKGEYVSRWLNENRTWDRRQQEVNAALGFVL